MTEYKGTDGMTEPRGLLEWLAEEMNRQTQRVTESVLYGSTWTAATINELVQEPCGCWYRTGERFKLCKRHLALFLGKGEPG